MGGGGGMPYYRGVCVCVCVCVACAIIGGKGRLSSRTLCDRSSLLPPPNSGSLTRLWGEFGLPAHGRGHGRDALLPRPRIRTQGISLAGGRSQSPPPSPGAARRTGCFGGAAVGSHSSQQWAGDEPPHRPQEGAGSSPGAPGGQRGAGLSAWEGQQRGHLTPGAQSFRHAATPRGGRGRGGGSASPAPNP